MKGENEKLSIPVQFSHISAGADLETLWQYAIENMLHLAPEETSLLVSLISLNMTVGPFYPKKAATIVNLYQTRDMRLPAEIAFERLNCPFLSVANKPTLAVLSTGQVTGMNSLFILSCIESIT